MIELKDITIIIPVYNGENYIEQCIKSAINQFPYGYDTMNNIIVVNDGSTDNTRNICTKFIPRISLINHSVNKNTASALNTGITYSKTDYIKWLSADDILKPDALRKIAELANLRCNHNNRIFYTHYDIINESNQVIKTFIEPLISYPKDKIVLLDHFYGNGSTSLIHKDIFRKCGMFDTSLGYQEDYEFWLRCSLLHDVRLTLLPINSLYYRVHPKQLTYQHRGESLIKSSYIKTKILNQVSPKMAEAYRKELLEYQKHIPLKIKIKRKIRKMVYQSR